MDAEDIIYSVLIYKESKINLCLRSNTSQRGSHLRRGAKGENMRNFILKVWVLQQSGPQIEWSAKLKTSKSRKNETNKREAHKPNKKYEKTQNCYYSMIIIIVAVTLIHWISFFFPLLLESNFDYFDGNHPNLQIDL